MSRISSSRPSAYQRVQNRVRNRTGGNRPAETQKNQQSLEIKDTFDRNSNTFGPKSEFHDQTFGPNSQYHNETFGPKSEYHTQTFRGGQTGAQGAQGSQGAQGANGQLPHGRVDENGFLVNRTNNLGLIQGSSSAANASLAITNPDGSSRFNFDANAPFKVNNNFFQVAEDGQAFSLKPGVNASDAIKDLMGPNASKYTFECATGISVFRGIQKYKEYQQKYGANADSRFDKDYNNNMSFGYWGRSNFSTDVNMGGKSSNPKAGEGVYFNNNNVDYQGKSQGWMGENAVYVGTAAADGPMSKEGVPLYKAGEQLYYGHPFGVTSEKHIKQELMGNATGVNYGAIDKVEQAMQGMTGPRQRQFGSLLQDLRSAQSNRSGNKAELERLNDLGFKYDKSDPRYQEALKKYQGAYKQDSSLDQNEADLQRRAQVLLKDVNSQLNNLGRDYFMRNSQQYKELQMQRDALTQLLPGNNTIDMLERW